MADQYPEGGETQRCATQGERDGEAKQEHNADHNKHGQCQLPFHQL